MAAVAGEDRLAGLVVGQAVDLGELAGGAVMLHAVEGVELLLAAGVVGIAAEVATVEGVGRGAAQTADEPRIVGGPLSHVLIVVVLVAVVAQESFVTAHFSASHVQHGEPALASPLRLAPGQSLLLHGDLSTVKDELLALRLLLVGLVYEVVDRLLDSIVLPLIHGLLILATIDLIHSIRVIRVDIQIQLRYRHDKLVQ